QLVSRLVNTRCVPVSVLPFFPPFFPPPGECPPHGVHRRYHEHWHRGRSQESGKHQDSPDFPHRCIVTSLWPRGKSILARETRAFPLPMSFKLPTRFPEDAFPLRLIPCSPWSGCRAQT